jgi:hypothetical protein
LAAIMTSWKLIFAIDFFRSCLFGRHFVVIRQFSL